MKNPAAGGGRWVDVAPGRIVSWLDDFAQRHGGGLAVRLGGAAEAVPGRDAAAGPGGGRASASGGGVAAEGGPGHGAGGTDRVTFIAADGTIAECHIPFPPLTSPLPGTGLTAAGACAAAIAAHALRDRTVAVLLVRLGGFSVGVFAGSPPVLRASKTGSRLVHGRSAAGGWSQHRFARRREKQASEALGAAAEAAVRVLGEAGPLDAVVLGGDRRAIDGLRDDPRLAGYLARAEDRFLTVPDPKLSVLEKTPRAFGAIRIRLIELTDHALPAPWPR